MGGDKIYLFETKHGRGRVAYRVFSGTVFVGIVLIWIYRFIQIANINILTTTTMVETERRRWIWTGMFAAELWFGTYWIINQSARWSIVHRRPYKDRLRLRYGDDLPAVDVLVCTADPTVKPAALVVSTVLSVMAFNYPPEKLSIYLSDYGCSATTFYALLEASRFSKHWIPFCKKFTVGPRSPAAYFSGGPDRNKDMGWAPREEWLSIEKLYEEMKDRIESAAKLGSIFPKRNKGSTQGVLRMGI